MAGVALARAGDEFWRRKQCVSVAVAVQHSRQEVFAFLDVLSNHEPFTNHMLADQSFDGPAAGLGAKVRARANVPGPADWIDTTVVVEAPVKIVEEAVGAKGRRRTRGTYTLEELPTGGTNLRFDYAYLEGPLRERPASPLIHAWTKRGLASSMRRLGQTLAERAAQPMAHEATRAE
jgi:hypothetical protein